MDNNQPNQSDAIPCSNPALEGWTFISMAAPRTPLMHVIGKTFVKEQPVERNKQRSSTTSSIPHSLSNANKELQQRKRVMDVPDASTPTLSSKRSRPIATSESTLTDPPQSLSEEQLMVHDFIVSEKKNVFFTGSAGTGKSVLLRHIIDTLRKKYGRNQVVVTASTGIAAVNIGGTTLHSFAKQGHDQFSVTQSVEKIRKHSMAHRLWIDAKVLIIDEVSMIDGSLLDKVEEIARTVRHKLSPFGGIQVIMSGDFFQLPPVSKTDNSKFAFEADCWHTVVDKSFILKHCFRQKDSKLIEILNQVRVGRVSREAETILKSLSRTPKVNLGIIPTELYPLQKEVTVANKKWLSKIESDLFKFDAIDSGDISFLDKTRAPKHLELKVGAQVMLIKNLSSVLVNGSLGVVTRFEKTNSRSFPVVKFTNGMEKVMHPEVWSFAPNGNTLASRQQVPLILAWALSIHKSQGQTIEYVKVDLANIFEPGHAYVALSRSVTIENLQVLNFRKEKIQADKKAAEFYQTIEDS